MKKQNKPITHLSWGKMQINIQDKEYEFKDCKIWPEGACKWDWNLTGTTHDTKKAVEVFNTLFQQSKRVGGIFHSTC